MKPLWINPVAGVPIERDFGTTGGMGTPLCIDTTTDRLYYLSATGVVTPILDGLSGTYKTILEAAGSHTAGRVAGTYGFGLGDPLAISGTGTLYPLAVIYLAAADFQTQNGELPKLRVRANLHCNDVAPTGNFTFALHPITRPAVSGGAGLCIYSIGAAVSGSGVTVNTPAADSSTSLTGADFNFPADGFYVLGLVTTATVAASAQCHANAFLQAHST